MSTTAPARCGIRVTPDLVEAALRSEDVPEDLPLSVIEEAVGRYVRWLEMIQRTGRRGNAPTRDIDRMWHLHMLSPVHYRDDCLANFGRILDHDGGFGSVESERAELIAAFESTEQAWLGEFEEPYRRSDLHWWFTSPAKRGRKPGCGRFDDHNAPATVMAAVAETDGEHNCWHDCSDRCWHACSNVESSGSE